MSIAYLAALSSIVALLIGCALPQIHDKKLHDGAITWIKLLVFTSAFCLFLHGLLIDYERGYLHHLLTVIP